MRKADCRSQHRTETGVAERLTGKKQRTDGLTLCNKAFSFNRTKKTVGYEHAVVINVTHFRMNLFAFNFVLMLLSQLDYNNTETNVAAYKKWLFCFFYFYWFYNSLLADVQAVDHSHY